MKVGKIVEPNKKGQIVIPKEYRDKLGIDENVPLNMVLRDQSLHIYPVDSLVAKKAADDEAFLQLLDKTQGSWAGDSWPETRKRRRKIELAASRRRKKAW